MHELGVLRHVIRTVEGVAQKNAIPRILYVTLEVGEASGFVPRYLEKLFPIAAEFATVTRDAQLRLVMVPGRGLVIRDIGY